MADNNDKISEDVMKSYGSINRAKGRSFSSRDIWHDIDTNTTIRDSFNRLDYEEFRPEESIATSSKAIINQCMNAYRKVGIIRNVVDLMADFGSQGITLTHSKKSVQKFYRDWFAKVSGAERSERFLNLLYRSGNIVIRRIDAKINTNIAKNMSSYAREKPIKPTKQTEIQKNTIPWRYIFLCPSSIDIISGRLGSFVGKPVYALKLPQLLKDVINTPGTDVEKTLVAQLPEYIKAKIKNGDSHIILDSDNIIAKFYKKDDWQVWADPMIYAIIDDILLLEKLKLADLSALDGVISQVRLWKLGSLEHEIYPTDTGIEKLRDVLSSNPGAGAFDVIWGPELTLEESNTSTHQFLGISKYEPTLNNIYAGLGIPPTLTGSGSAAGYTNNFISLKTLVKRLEYGRSLLTEFWNDEIKLVQKAMGFQQPAKVQYDRMVLTDEGAEKELMLKLWDRNLITDQTILERYGEDPDFEQIVNQREEEERKSELRPMKASPYHVSEKDHELKKIALGRGYIKPSQAGIKVKESYKEEPFIVQAEQKTAFQDKTSKSPQPSGRPKSVKDSYKRQRSPSVRTSADELLWVKAAQKKISYIVSPYIISFFNKKDIRSLTTQECEQCELIKFSVLASIAPYQDIDEKNIINILKEGKNLPNSFRDKYLEYTAGRDYSIDEQREIQALVYLELIE
jgi:hypothetical protein